jgi:hypothetical protein
MTNQSNHQRAITWLADYIRNNPDVDTSFRNISFILKKEKQYYIKCYLSDNKYLYGSFISEAKTLANSLISSEAI